MIPQFLDFEGLDIAAGVTSIAVSSSVPARHGRAARDGHPLVRRHSPASSSNPGRRRDADPLRQPERGRSRPDRERGRRLRPLRRAVRSSSTSVRRPPSRRSAPRASTSAARSRPGSRSASRRSIQQAAALRRVELVEPRSVIGRSTVESIQSGAALRVRRARSTRCAALPGRARRRHRRGHRRAQLADRPALRARSSTSSPGSPCTACGSCSNATSPDGPRVSRDRVRYRFERTTGRRRGRRAMRPPSPRGGVGRRRRGRRPR